jgi:hypothetical protein
LSWRSGQSSSCRSSSKTRSSSKAKRYAEARAEAEASKSERVGCNSSQGLGFRVKASKSERDKAGAKETEHEQE